jgi:NADPH:quinone reductase
MSTYRALAVTEFGKPLSMVSLPIPEPKDNEILLKVTAAGRKY